MKDNLKLIMKKAYANISNYKVACVIVMQNNQEVIGVNIENKMVKVECVQNKLR